MENNQGNKERPPIEHDYNANDQNPGPSEEAVTEKDDRSVGTVMKWLIPIFIVVLLIAWFFLKGE